MRSHFSKSVKYLRDYIYPPLTPTPADTPTHTHTLPFLIRSFKSLAIFKDVQGHYLSLSWTAMLFLRYFLSVIWWSKYLCINRSSGRYTFFRPYLCEVAGSNRIHTPMKFSTWHALELKLEDMWRVYESSLYIRRLKHCFFN